MPRASRPFRIADAMLLIAAIAIAAWMLRWNRPVLAFQTFGGHWEQFAFYWMHMISPLPAALTLAVCLLARTNRTPGHRPGRYAGVAGCYAAGAVIAALVAFGGAFYAAHLLEDAGVIPRIFVHTREAHPPPLFGFVPLGEVGGAAVLGAWAALLGGRRWRAERSWLDRLGRALGLFWIALLMLYFYAYG